MASSGNRFSSTLSSDCLEKAKKELNEIPDNRDDKIRKLRENIMIKETSCDPELDGVLFENKDDAFLLRFLRARKFDNDRALQLYISHYQSKQQYPEIYSDFTHQSVDQLLRNGMISVLDHSANDGAKIICVKPKHVDIDNISCWLLLRCFLIVIDKLLTDEETQVNGVRIIINYEDVEFLKVWKFSQIETTKNGIMPKLMQDSIPIRLKGIHLVKQPWYVSILLTILKSFMKEKMKKRVNMHGYDYQSLHDTFQSEYLPSDFDGPLPSVENFIAARLFQQN